MPVPIQTSQIPWSALDGGTSVDAATGQVPARFVITLWGTVAQVQADWATLVGTSLSCPSSVICNDG